MTRTNPAYEEDLDRDDPKRDGWVDHLIDQADQKRDEP